MCGIRHIVATGGVLASLATTVTGQEELPAVPSGISLHLQEVRVDPGPNDAPMIRFRYVAPDLGDFVQVEEDFPVLCAEQVLPWAETQAPDARRAVISIASEPVEFGVAAPEVTQYFEQFRLEDATCIWEGL